MKKLSIKAQQCLKEWQEQIDKEGEASLLGESEVARELLDNGYAEKSPFGGAYQVITCYECSQIKKTVELKDDNNFNLVCDECFKKTKK